VALQRGCLLFLSIHSLAYHQSHKGVFHAFDRKTKPYGRQSDISGQDLWILIDAGGESDGLELVLRYELQNVRIAGRQRFLVLPDGTDATDLFMDLECQSTVYRSTSLRRPRSYLVVSKRALQVRSGRHLERQSGFSNGHICSVLFWFVGWNRCDNGGGCSRL